MGARRFTALAAAAAAASAFLVPLSARAATSVVDGIVRSDDGTAIAYTLFEPDGASASSPVPVIFMTHGWGGTRTRTLATTSNNVVVDTMAGTLVKAGYAVVTWDSRGFGDSGGEAEVDSQQYEVRDVEALIDMALTHSEIATDGPGDPKMGMIGGSYAGGIQLEVASADSRVDAIVPQIPWNDLPNALKPGGVLKLGWDELLYAAGAAAAASDGVDAPQGPETGVYAPEIHRSEAEGAALNDWTGATLDWFDARSPKHYINGAHLGSVELPGIHAAVLDQQGISDTLFNLNHGIANVAQAAANGATVKLMGFCGGHAANLSCAKGDQSRLTTRAIDWFNRYVKGDTSIATGDPIEYQTQDGNWHSIAAWPSTTVASATGNATLVNQFAPTNPGTPGLGTVEAANADAAPTAVRIPLTVTGTTLLGIPRVNYSYTGAGAEAYVFAKLVDVAPAGTAVAVDDQVTPIKLTDLSALNTHVASVDLAGVAWSIAPGHQLFLELTTTSSNFASSRTPSVVVLGASVEVPGLV